MAPEADRLGGFEVDHQSCFVSACTGRLAGFSPLRSVDIAGRLPEQSGQIGPVGDQAALVDVVAIGIDRGHRCCTASENQVAVKARRSAGMDQAAVGNARKGGDGAFDLERVAHIDWHDFYAQRRRHGLDHGELSNPAGIAGVTKDRRPRHARSDLLE